MDVLIGILVGVALTLFATKLVIPNLKK